MAGAFLALSGIDSSQLFSQTALSCFFIPCSCALCTYNWRHARHAKIGLIFFCCVGSFRPNHGPYNHIIIRIRSCQLFLAFSPVRSIVTVSRELFLDFPGSPRSAAHLLSANPRLCRSQCRLSSRRCSKWKTFPVLSTDPTLSCSQGTISCHPRPES